MEAADVRVGGLAYLLTTASVEGLWLPPEGGMRRFHVGAVDSILPRVEALQQALRDPVAVARGRVPGLDAFVADWGRAFLPRGVEAWPDVVVVTLHGDLHGLPIHLVTADADGTSLGALAGVSYASSVSLLARCMALNPARTGRDDAHGQPGPARPNITVSGAVDVLGDQDPAFDRLCRALAESLPGKTYHFGASGFGFTRAACKAVLRSRDPDALLIMAHGYTDAEDHRFSGLLLARDPGVGARVIPLHGGRYFDFRDLPLRPFPAELNPSRDAELLTTAEMEIDLSLSAALVVLLGCSAGWGRVSEGDEPQSLAETFLHLGACSVAAPLWDCDMDAAQAWSRAFLRAWAEWDYPKALAARHALRETSRAGAGPAHWGVMALRGDWL